ncbi:MAG TPA: phage tail tape measure protein [Allosphingosinicella sp.]
MSGENQAEIKITATSEVAAGIDQAKGSIEGLSGFIEEMKAGFAGMTGAVEQLQAQFVTLGESIESAMVRGRAATEEQATGIKALVLSAKGGVESFNAMKSSIAGFGTAIVAALGVEMLVHGVEKLTGAATTYTADVEKLAKAFGISLGAADGFQLALHKLGIETDTATGMANKMVRQMRQHEDAFNRLGVATRDSEGHFRDLQDIFLDGLDKMRDYQEGVDRTAASQIMFGRGAGDLTQILRLNREELEEGKKAAEELGLQTTGEGVEAMHQYKEAVAEASETWDTFKIMLGQELLPTLKDMAVWFRSEGPAAIKTTIADINSFVGEIKAIPAAWNFVTASLNLALEGWEGFFDEINLWLDKLEAKIELFGMTSTMALSGHVSEAVEVWRAGLKQIGDAADIEGARIVRDANRASAAWDHALAAMNAAMGGSVDTGWMDASGKNDPNYRGMEDGPEPTDPTAGADNRLDDIKQQHPKKDKKPKDDLVQILDERLKAQQVEWDLEQAAQGKAQEFSLASVTAYWKQYLNIQGASVKDKFAIDERYTAAFKAQMDKENAVFLTSQRKKMDQAKNDEKERQHLAQETYDREASLYGADSNQAQAAADQLVRINTEAAEKLKQIAEDQARHDQKMADLKIQAERERAQFMVSMGLMTQRQLIEIDRQLENERYQDQVKSLNQQLAAEKAQTPQYQKIWQQLQEARKQHENTLTGITQKAVLQRTQLERNAISQLSSSWGQAIGKMVTLQASFASTIKSLWQGLQQAIGSAIASIIEQWLVKHLSALLIGGAASKASAAGQISNQAAVAGAGGTASMAAAPWPMDMTAVGFGIEMATAAGAFASGLTIPSAAGGYDIPSGINPLVQAHAREMILPAQYADVIRSLATAPKFSLPSMAMPAFSLPAGLNSPIAASLSRSAQSQPPQQSAANASVGSTIVNHFHGPTDKASIERWFLDNHVGVAKAADHAVRQGFRPKSVAR